MKKTLVRLLCCFIPGRNNRRLIRNHFCPKQKPTWMGRHSYIGGNFSRMHPDTTVGAFCSIGQNVGLGPSQHPSDWLSTAPFQYVNSKKITSDQPLCKWSILPVTIGNDVWIGNNAIIKDGVKIANGCIIGSNAVVTHDTPPYAVMGGVPARIINIDSRLK